jgi:hypothetical protein
MKHPSTELSSSKSHGTQQNALKNTRKERQQGSASRLGRTTSRKERRRWGDEPQVEEDGIEECGVNGDAYRGGDAVAGN